MVLGSTAELVFDTLIGVAVFVALIVLWRVWVHDKTIRKIRFGVFYERERDDQER